MVSSFLGCLQRRAVKNAAVFCVPMVFIIGFFYNYKHELEILKLQASQSPGSKTSLESYREGCDPKSFHRTNREPIIFLYNAFFDSPHWYSQWDSVEGSSTVRTLKNCAQKCLFASDPCLLKSADSVIVSLANYKGYAGKPV